MMARCPRCDEPMPAGTPLTSHPNRRSVDHILPLEYGGKNMIHGDVRNTQIMCQHCNSMRALHFHCWALWVCVKTVAQDEGVKPITVYRRWGLGKLRAKMTVTRTARDQVALSDDDYRRRAQNARSVEIARQIDRIGLDEFIWPADTAAKRAWNMATLAKRYSGPVTP